MRMGKREESDSEGDGSERSEESSGGDESARKKGIPEYEKRRLSRIADNKAIMEAMGLRGMASSFLSSAPPREQAIRKGKRKVGYDDDADEDYKPNDDDDDDFHSNDDEDEELEEDDEDYVGGKSCSKSRSGNKPRTKTLKSKKKHPVQKSVSGAGCIDEEDDDDDELKQAIALSLQDTVTDQKKKNAHIQEDAGRRKQRKTFSSRVQMTEDELIMHFFQFNESGTGLITMRDLKRVAASHDFTWTDKELADMIHCFDSDGDGKLNLEDFRKIVDRCHMIRGSDDC